MCRCLFRGSYDDRMRPRICQPANASVPPPQPLCVSPLSLPRRVRAAPRGAARRGARTFLHGPLSRCLARGVYYLATRPRNCQPHAQASVPPRNPSAPGGVGTPLSINVCPGALPVVLPPAVLLPLVGPPVSHVSLLDSSATGAHGCPGRGGRQKLGAHNVLVECARLNCHKLTVSLGTSGSAPTASMPDAACPHCILVARYLGILANFSHFGGDGLGFIFTAYAAGTACGCPSGDSSAAGDRAHPTTAPSSTMWAGARCGPGKRPRGRLA